MLNLRCLLSFLALSIALAAAASADPALGLVYSWVEANGNMKYAGERPTHPVKDLRIYRLPTAPVSLPPRAVQPAERTSFDSIIEREASANSIPVDLVRAVIQVESNFNTRARSSVGAMGLMQLMPATAADLGVQNPYDPAQNIRGGVAYLRQLLDRYGTEELALAAYNAGPEAVGRYGNRVPPYSETRNYVQRIASRDSAGRTVAGRSASTGNAAKSQLPPPAARVPVFYKTIEIIDGRAVPKYSGTKPAAGPYEIVSG
jgi:soluble lytic murein transglycosylase-like protein